MKPVAFCQDESIQAQGQNGPGGGRQSEGSEGGVSVGYGCSDG